jgi:prepilin-type N-terminal cleavage/methylation domain-containing protein
VKALRNRRAGFSMIEVLVAMAIASVGLAAIFELQHQLTSGQRRYERAMHRAELKRDMLAILRDLNPLAQPSGQIELPPGQRLRWAARPISTLRVSAGLPVGDGPFQVQLYTVTAQVTDDGGRSLEQVSFDRMGWRRITPAASGSSSSQPPGAAGAVAGTGQTTLPVQP